MNKKNEPLSSWGLSPDGFIERMYAIDDGLKVVPGRNTIPSCFGEIGGSRRDEFVCLWSETEGVVVFVPNDEIKKKILEDVPSTIPPERAKELTFIPLATELVLETLWYLCIADGEGRASPVTRLGDLGDAVVIAGGFHLEQDEGVHEVHVVISNPIQGVKLRKPFPEESPRVTSAEDEVRQKVLITLRLRVFEEPVLETGV